jgi:hypothetical protein
MPLRQPACRRTMLAPKRDAAPVPHHARHKHLHWGAEALWQRLEPLLPGISVEVLARMESTNTRLLRARAMSGQRDAPVTRPGDLDGLSRDQRTPHGRRRATSRPACWWPSCRPAAAAAWGGAGSAARAHR